MIASSFLLIENLMVVLFCLISLFMISSLAMMFRWYKKAEPGMAMIRTGQGGIRIETDGGMFVFPVFHKMEMMDISMKTVSVERVEKNGMFCKDNIRADIKVTFFVRVGSQIKDIEQVARTIGCQRAGSLETIEQLFLAKFEEAVKIVGKKMEFEKIHENLESFKKEIFYTIGMDLNGYVLEDCVIEQFEQTHIRYLDENNILDAKGIEKIKLQNHKYQRK